MVLAAATRAPCPPGRATCAGEFPQPERTLSAPAGREQPLWRSCGGKGGIAFGEARPSRRTHSRLASRQWGLSQHLPRRKAARRSAQSMKPSQGLRQEWPKAKQRKRKASDRIARRFATSHEQELWMGDIPSEYATKKALAGCSGDPVGRASLRPSSSE